MIPVFTFIDSKFSTINFDNLFDNPETFDFNDKYYGYCIFSLNAYIVTNDADFFRCDSVQYNNQKPNTIKLLN